MKSFLSDLAALRFLPAGNCLRRVSCSTWLHCVSCRQETVYEWFPVRLGGIAFLTGRKLFAYSFLLGVAPLCFLPAGNYSRRVSCSAWLHCVSCWQETIREGFPTRLGSTVFLADRKLFAKGFLLDLAPLCFLPTGNCLRRVSCSTWHCGVSCRQETVCEGFPTRRGFTVFLAGRKLFAKGFLPGVTLWRFLPAGNCSKGDFSTPLRYARNDRGGVVAWCFLPTGNFSRIVSCSTWHCGVSYRQETVCEGFPARRGSTVFLADRKLFAKGFLLDVAPLCFLPTGNFSRIVSCST